MPTAPYRNQRLNLKSLAHRRTKYDRMLCFKIIHGIAKIDPLELYSFKPSRTRGLAIKLALPRFRTFVRKHSFSVRSAYSFNKLPNILQAVKSLGVFARELEKVDDWWKTMSVFSVDSIPSSASHHFFVSSSLLMRWSCMFDMCQLLCICRFVFDLFSLRIHLVLPISPAVGFSLAMLCIVAIAAYAFFLYYITL